MNIGCFWCACESSVCSCYFQIRSYDFRVDCDKNLVSLMMESDLFGDSKLLCLATVLFQPWWRVLCPRCCNLQYRVVRLRKQSFVLMNKRFLALKRDLISSLKDYGSCMDRRRQPSLEGRRGESRALLTHKAVKPI
jgi:hypothetical protein